MQVKMLMAKIHRATVTEADLNYQGSITIDRELLMQSGILPHQAVSIYNITNGNRIETYTIEGPPGSRTICINGAAAHLCKKGDRVIICAYGFMERLEATAHRPGVLVLDEENNVVDLFHYGSPSTPK